MTSCDNSKELSNQKCEELWIHIVNLKKNYKQNFYCARIIHCDVQK